MSAPASRRGVLLGLAALPAAGGAVVQPPDPHVALAEDAVAIWRRHKATCWAWSMPATTEACRAASAAHAALMDHCLAAAEIPPPATLPGLRALALLLALSNEEAWSEDEDRVEHQRRTFIEAAVTITGAELPEGFAGMLHRDAVGPA